MDKIRYASKSLEQIRDERIERDLSHIFIPATLSRPNVIRSAVLVRFRRFIEGEPLNARIIREFLESREHWWLLTTNVTERVHAATVLYRLLYLATVSEIHAEAAEALARDIKGEES